MIALPILSALLRALGVLASTAGFKDGAVLTKVLNLAALAVDRGEAGRIQMEQLCAQIDVMVAQGRPPTDEEWAQLSHRSDAAHAAIQAAAEASGAGGDPAPVAESEGGEAN